MVTKKRYLCPDLTVTCGPRESDELEEHGDLPLLRYPKLISEVLSNSTTYLGCGAKFELYQGLPTLEAYVVVDTKRPKVLVYRRAEDDLWMIRILGRESTVGRTSIGFCCSIADIYVKARFAKQGT